MSGGWGFPISAAAAAFMRALRLRLSDRSVIIQCLLTP